MNLRALAAAIAVIAVPIAVQGAETPRSSAQPRVKRTCEVTVPMGSRLGGVRRCRSAQEREEHKAEARDVVDRVQRMKPTLCPPYC
ncbi:MAG TPA: hypothetical protein VMS43_11995 [Allosphingosinicella sp.]|nr:hypothetical protein [Allosphingosinicella sp.]